MAQDFATKMAERIKQLRLARGLSVRGLARVSGLKPESVSRSERGVTEITVTSLAKVCAGLGIDLPTFFQFEGATAVPTMRADVQLLAQKLSEMPPDRLRDVARALGVLLDLEPKVAAGALGETKAPRKKKPGTARRVPASKKVKVTRRRK